MDNLFHTMFVGISYVATTALMSLRLLSQPVPQNTVPVDKIRDMPASVLSPLDSFTSVKHIFAPSSTPTPTLTATPTPTVSPYKGAPTTKQGISTGTQGTLQVYPPPDAVAPTQSSFTQLPVPTVGVKNRSTCLSDAEVNYENQMEYLKSRGLADSGYAESTKGQYEAAQRACYISETAGSSSRTENSRQNVSSCINAAQSTYKAQMDYLQSKGLTSGSYTDSVKVQYEAAQQNCYSQSVKGASTTNIFWIFIVMGRIVIVCATALLGVWLVTRQLSKKHKVNTSYAKRRSSNKRKR